MNQVGRITKQIANMASVAQLYFLFIKKGFAYKVYWPIRHV